jgi:hypothetical protein
MKVKGKLGGVLVGGALVLLLLVQGVVQSQEGPADDAAAAGQVECLVRLQTADVVLRPGVYETGEHRYAVLRLSRNLRRAEIDSLAAAGVRLLTYLGDGAFIAGVDSGALSASVCQRYGIEAAAPWRAENKATPTLRQGAAPDWALAEGGRLKLVVAFFADVGPSQIDAILARHATSYTVESPPRYWAVEIEPARLPALLAEQGVYTVEPGPMPFQPLLDESRALIHVDEVQQANIVADPPSIEYSGLTGKGIMLQVSEGVWDGHPDFLDADGQTRVYNPSPASGSAHGTSVAGIMAGSGVHSASLEGTPFYAEIGHWRGMAPEASLYEGEYWGDEPLIDASNHSWVMDYGDYGWRSGAVDQQIHGDSGAARQWPQIWAAGNQGHQAQYDDEEGYYSIYAPAKNSIAVGSVNANDGSLSGYVSSLGPTFDGRIKPDVMAPGSKNHLPRGFNLDQDRLQVWFDYIRIYNQRTGSLDAAWEFNQNGNPEGWFQSNVNQLYNVTVTGGVLGLRVGFQPSTMAWGEKDPVNVQSDPSQVVTIRYKMRAPGGSMAAALRFVWGWSDGPAYGFGNIYFPYMADDRWHVTTLQVGQWGQDRDGLLGQWKGQIFLLGMQFAPYWPGIVSPAVIGGGPENPESIVSAGEYHTCALRPCGQAECWGAMVPANDHGQAADQPGPFRQVGAGALHSCGLRPDGSVQCWGANGYGQAEDQIGPFTQISVGGVHNCGLRPDGSVDCWGQEDLGMADDQPGPFTQISAGWQHTCGLTPAGAIDCWGLNAYGEAADKAGPFVQVSAGWGHTCGLRPDGSAECWGQNDDGQAESQTGPFTQISAGGRHTCGLKADGSVDCWGFNSEGQAEDQSGPFTQISAGGTWLAGATRWGHTCGLTDSNNVVCWGSNGDGQAEDQPGPFGPLRYAYRSTQGTSEAAPAVTGGVALILQQFRDGLGLDIKEDPPLPSTIKALLIQTAADLVHTLADPRDVENPDTGAPVLYFEGPDFATGYGLVNIQAAVDLVGAGPGPGSASRLIHEGGLDADGQDVYELWWTSEDIARLGDELKFTLAWDDAAASSTTPETQPKLVNDLDLTVIDPHGSTHLPWTLDPLPVADCGGAGPGCGDPDPIAPEDVLPAYRGADHRNNVEMVQVSGLIPGRWLVVVDAYDVPMPMQSYSLVGNQPTQLESPTLRRYYLPLVLRNWNSHSVGMVYVPAGEFLMGSTNDHPEAQSDEKPHYAVYPDGTASTKRK